MQEHCNVQPINVLIAFIRFSLNKLE